MNIIKNIVTSLVVLMVAGCSTYEPTEEDYQTNYLEDEIYILQQDVVMESTGRFMWHSSIDKPRYFLSDDLHLKNVSRIPKGSRVQYKKIIVDNNNPTIGIMFRPVGYLLDKPFEETPVILTFISQQSETVESKMGAHGNFINPDFLILEKENNSNQILDPTWTTPVD